MNRAPRLHPGVEPVPFHQIQRGTHNHRGLKRFGQIVMFPVFYAVFAVVFTAGAAYIAALTAGLPGDTADVNVWVAQLTATPAGLVMLTAGLIALIPASIVAAGVAYTLRPGWLFSVTGRIRWAYLGVLTGAAAVVSLMLVIPDVDRAGPPLWAVAGTALLVIPLQAVGEEVFFRGWLLQAVSRAKRAPVIAVGFSSALFGLAHIANGAPSVAAYTWFVLFGAVAAVLTIVTGGLEAAIGLHLSHNTVAMLALSLSGNTPAVALDAGQVGWGYVAVSAAVMGLYTAFAVWLHRRWNVARLTTPGLQAVTRHVYVETTVKETP